MKGLKYTVNLRNGLTFNTCGFNKEMALSNFKMHFPAYANEKVYPVWYVNSTGEWA